MKSFRINTDGYIAKKESLGMCVYLLDNCNIKPWGNLGDSTIMHPSSRISDNGFRQVETGLAQN